MRFFFILVFFISSAFSLELVLNTGRQDDAPFGVLHIKNDRAFSCQELAVDNTSYFECELEGKLDHKLENQNFRFFDLSFEEQNASVKISIYPKIAAKMFNLEQELFSDTQISKSDALIKSKEFSFIFSQEMPFIQDSTGLNFDIIFPGLVKPSIGALDLDSNPVYIPQSADINTFLRIKQEFDKGNYKSVEDEAQAAIQRYQGSIFTNEFMLYKFRAQTQLYTYANDYRHQKILEDMIEEMKLWNKTFTSDKNFPEVLYMMMRAYIASEQRSNVDYTINVLSTEYADHYFGQLAKLDYGDYLFELGKRDEANALYNNVYYTTQNLDLAARAGASLAKIALLRNQDEAAQNYINVILQANKDYLKKDKKRVLDLAGLLYTHKLFDLSASLYEQAFESLEVLDDEYESALRNLALAMSKTSNYQSAEKYLNLYNDRFSDSQYSSLIKEALDEVFFNIPENNASFLHQRYKELQEEYAGDIALKALIYDVKLYANENNHKAVLDYQNEIERYNNQELKDILLNSGLVQINEFLRADQCENVISIVDKLSSYEIAQKTSLKKELLNCLIRASRIDQAKAYINTNRLEDSIFYDLKLAQLELNDKNYPQSIKLAQSVINSRIMKSKQEEFQAYYYNFLANLRQDNYNEAIRILNILQTYEMNYEMIELYHEFLLYCAEHNLQSSILKYAPIAIDFQNLKGVNVYSPELEFIYIKALDQAQRYQEALAVLQDLLKLKLSLDDASRAFYTQSEIYAKLDNINAQRQSLNSCVQNQDSNTSSSWQGLCQDRLNILNSEQNSN